jgi:hypothetical protein
MFLYRFDEKNIDVCRKTILVQVNNLQLLMQFRISVKG